MGEWPAMATNMTTISVDKKTRDALVKASSQWSIKPLEGFMRAMLAGWALLDDIDQADCIRKVKK